MATFQKRGAAQAAVPKGTRPSAFNAQLLCSTGLHDLDDLLGGGLAVGTMLLVEDDPLGRYSRSLVSSFLSAGVWGRHSLFVVDDLTLADAEFLETLPGPSAARSSPDPTPQSGPDGLKVAWQYAKYGPSAASAARPAAPPLCPTFRFGVAFDTAAVEEARGRFQRTRLRDLTVGPDVSAEAAVGALCARVLKDLTTFLGAQGPTATAGAGAASLCRVVLQDFGSLAWGVPGPQVDQCLLAFLFRVLGLVRAHRLVALVTVPTLRSSVGFSRRLRHLVDAAVSLRSWAGAGIAVSEFEASEYTGRLDLVKLPRSNALTAPHPGVTAFGFKAHASGRLTVVRLSLPPGDDVTNSSAPMEGGCGSGSTSTALDF